MVAIVTGSSSGIGQAVAMQLAAAGYRIVVNYLSSEASAQETATEVRACGSECIVVQGDVSSASDCRRIVAAASSEWGRVDVLVNNAGFTRAGALNEIDRITEEDWDRTFAVNARGTFFMSRECATHLRRAHGCIVNMSSTAAINGVGSSIPYAASKAAVSNLTLSLARALAPDVRVNAVLPGFVETSWNERNLGDRLGKVRKRVVAQTPLADVARPDHVAQVVRSLVDGMDWVTGEAIVVDGGLVVGRA
jgi:3-oxoacyl-[acyl-carrier protein] reductase